MRDMDKNTEEKVGNSKFWNVTERIRQLGKTKNPENIAELEKYLEDDNQIYCFWTVNSLMQMGNVNAIPILEKFAKDTRYTFLRDVTNEAIQRIKDMNGIGKFNLERGIRTLNIVLNFLRYPYGKRGLANVKKISNRNR